MKQLQIMGAAMIALAFVGGPAFADPLSKHPAVEVVTPTAKGPKPYFASLGGECSGSGCVHDFGKKGNKARTIDIVTCGMVTGGGEGIYGFVYFNDEPRYIFPIGSHSIAGGLDYSMSVFQYPFTVPAGVVLKVLYFSGGTPTSSFCSVGGTIE
jgi:hypothetical protein